LAGAIFESAGAINENGGAIYENGGALIESGGALNENGGAIYESGGALNENGGALNENGGVINENGGALNESGGAINENGGAINENRGTISYLWEKIKFCVNSKKQLLYDSADLQSVPIPIIKPNLFFFLFIFFSHFVDVLCGHGLQIRAIVRRDISAPSGGYVVNQDIINTY
jgi:hypothetical protein